MPAVLRCGHEKDNFMRVRDRRAVAPVCAGVLLAGLIVAAVYYLVTVAGLEALRIFIKA